MDFRRYSLPWYAYALLAYAVLGTIWWSILLLRKNAETFDARIADLTTRMTISRELEPGQTIESTAVYQEAARDFRAQRGMIVGEAILLLTCILGGAYLIYRDLRNRLMAADQQRSFLLSITHELKSPIAGVRLILETFQKRRDLPEGTQEKLSTNGLKEADRLTELVNNLLLSAKLESGYQLSKEQLDLKALLLEAVDVVKTKYPTAVVKLCTDDDLPFFRGDDAGMTSVILNLVENAAKYSQPTPVIEVELVQNGPEELVMTVADNGPGVPDEHKSKVWRRFYRVGNEDTRRTKGTGLGLFIVKEMVQRHGGIIELDDNEPTGSKFRVRLPL
ncbi:MAG: HAMP domain-containing sensor histidine kinase [Bacteroidota bacterium]